MKFETFLNYFCAREKKARMLKVEVLEVLLTYLNHKKELKQPC